MTAPAADDVPTLDEARAEIAARLDGLSLKPIALAVLDFVEGNGERAFGMEEAAEAAGLPAPSGELLARVEEGGSYAHPVTGSLLDDPERSFYLRFSARPGLVPEPAAGPRH